MSSLAYALWDRAHTLRWINVFRFALTQRIIWSFPVNILIEVHQKLCVVGWDFEVLAVFPEKHECLITEKHTISLMTTVRPAYSSSMTFSPNIPAAVSVGSIVKGSEGWVWRCEFIGLQRPIESRYSLHKPVTNKPCGKSAVSALCVCVCVCVCYLGAIKVYPYSSNFSCCMVSKTTERGRDLNVFRQHIDFFLNAISI